MKGIGGLDNPITAVTLNNMGLVYRQIGQYDKALTYYS